MELQSGFPTRFSTAHDLVFFDVFTLVSTTRTYDRAEQQPMRLGGSTFGVLGFVGVDGRWY